VHDAAGVLGDLVGRNLPEQLIGAHHRRKDGTDRRCHTHPLFQRDVAAGEDPAKSPLDVLVLRVVASVAGDLLERSLIARVNEEQLLVLEDPCDERVDEARPRGRDGGIVVEVEARDDVLTECVQAKVKRKQDLLLALEVVVERSLRDAEAFRDLPKRRPLVSPLVEQVEGDVEDPLPRRLTATPWHSFARSLGHRSGFYLTAGKLLGTFFTMSNWPTGKLMIEAHDLHKRFGSTTALDGLGLGVPEGGVLGVLGPNGAGKTTAVRVLTTLTIPDAGSARIAGHDVVREPRDVQARIGVTGQDTTLDEVLTGRQNLVMVGRLRGLARSQARAQADRLLEDFDLVDAGRRVVKEYSGGMRRRLDLAASLVTRPPVLFLDEPTTGLDPASRLRTWTVIRGLVADGATVLLTTQYLEEADELADRIVVVDRGRAIAEGTAPELKRQVGGARLEVTLSNPDPVAAGVLGRFADGGRVLVSRDGRLLRAPVPNTGGLATTIVRVLDEVGVVVDDVQVHQPSLDDVFLALTGRGAEDEEERELEEVVG
jgi:ABC-2 type transport system ATP-binding protein